MKKIVLLLVCLPMLAIANPANEFDFGDPELASINAITFGPDGILFIGDSQNASIIAIETEDKTFREAPEKFAMEKVDEQIAALLGTTKDAITIQDMAVNPISKKVYIAVHLQDGTPAIVTTKGEKFALFSTKTVAYQKLRLTQAVAADAKDRRGRSLRKWAISDMIFYNDRIMVSGLSNEEFSSSFRSIKYPFEYDEAPTSLEIYHAAHGRYETYAPIKTFMLYSLNAEPHIIASYTCTPLVIFPLDEMKSGEHTKGKTVAELGNRNTPLDMISYVKDGKPYLLLANTTRALMKIDPEEISVYKDYLTQPVSESSATAGVSFLALPYVNVQQLAKFSDDKVLLLQRMADGDLHLHMPDVRRL